MNYNKLFLNTKRTDLIGKNLSTVTVSGADIENEDKWDAPRFAMQGKFCCGHETELSDILTLEISENGRPLEFEPKRNSWTPAYLETYYRCTPQKEYYVHHGCIFAKETKAITAGDVFVSEMTVANNKKEKTTLKIKLSSPLEFLGNSIYKAAGKVLANATEKNLEFTGYICLLGCEPEFEITLAPEEIYKFKYVFAYGLSEEAAKEKANEELAKKDSFKDNENAINSWFSENVPALKTENRILEKIYYYRYLMIYINSFTPMDVNPADKLPGAVMYENRYGGWFDCAIALPVPLQINEAKWLGNGELSVSQIDLWTGGGVYMGYIQYTPYSIWEYYVNHKDKALLERSYEFCKEFTLKDYDEKNPLPIRIGSWPTGAEYSASFYQHTEPAWDWRCDSEGYAKEGFEISALYRLDEITYFAANLMAMRNMARVLGKPDEADKFESILKTITEKIKENFWNEKDKMFYDIDVKSGKQCDEAACYNSYAPFAFGIIDDEKYISCFDKLMDENWFADDFSITTTAKDCPIYWFDNHIAGPTASSPQNPHFYSCCWNGPIWPYAVSLVLNALGEAAKKYPQLQEKWLVIFEKYMNLHFLNGDFNVPCIFEHYRPGEATTFSKHGDYFHSAGVDLFMKYWAGISVTEDGVTFAPFTTEEFALENVKIGGKSYTFRQYADGRTEIE